jgi:uncharacterized paraquat-inducible protein A
MKLYDHIDTKPLLAKLENLCPICQEPLENDESLRFPELECPKCHLRIKVTSRNNDRMAFAGFLLLLLFAFGFALGVSL